MFLQVTQGRMLQWIRKALGMYFPWAVCEGSETEDQGDSDGQIILMVVAPRKHLQQVRMPRQSPMETSHLRSLRSPQAPGDFVDYANWLCK